MNYYIIYLSCNLCLLLVIRRFLSDFFVFNEKNKGRRLLFSCCWYLGTFLVNEYLHITVVNLAVNLLLMFLVSCTYEGTVWKKALVTLLIAVISAACDMLAYVIATPLLDESENYYGYAFTVVFVLLLERLLGIAIRREKTWDIVGKEMLALSAFPIMASVILYCVTAMQEGIYRFVACLCVVGISALSVILYNSLSLSLGERMRKRFLEREVEAYRHEMETMRISARKEENLRHDLRHHLFEIEGLALQGKDKEICSYITDIRESFADSKQMLHTGEYETDSLINFLIDNAKSKHINVTCDVKIPEDIDLSKCKLNVIVGNLLENAIEAASTAEKREIAIAMQYSGGVLFLQIKNTFAGEVNVESGKVVGRHHIKNHGIGLRSVRDLVEQQNGKLELSVTAGVFTAEGMIPLE